MGTSWFSPRIDSTITNNTMAHSYAYAGKNSKKKTLATTVCILITQGIAFPHNKYLDAIQIGISRIKRSLSLPKLNYR